MALTDYSKVSAPFGILELGHPYLTEFAQEIQQIQSVDPLLEALPQRMIPEKEVRVEWTESELRLLGIVLPGKPNKMNSFGDAKSFSFKPAYFRRGDFLDMELVNHLRQAGSMQKTYGMDLIQERLMNLLDQANLMMSVLRAQLLTGGINLTDNETGFSVVANSGIPAANLYTTAALTGGAWTDTTNAKIVDDVQKLLYTMELQGRNRPTHMIMSAPMHELVSRNAQVRSFLSQLTGLANMGLVTWGQDGLVESIAGIKIIVHKMLFDDDTKGRKFMWPVHKVTFVSMTHPSMPTQKLGYTVLTKGEHPADGMGVWVRTGEVREDNLIDPTLPPGVPMQVGMAGLPVLYKPYWAHVVSVAADEAAVSTALTGAATSKYIP